MPGRSIDHNHPDVQSLHKAGIPKERINQLAKIHMIDHPAVISGVNDTQLKKEDPAAYDTQLKLAAEVANLKKDTKGKPKAPDSNFVTDPSSPSQYARDILEAAGLPDTASNEALLERQMSQEGMPGSENNPLASSLPETGSQTIPGNPDNVQEYPSSLEGAIADAATLKGSYESSLYDALKAGNATPEQYAAALANSNYEGVGGSSIPANVAYGQAFLGEQPATSFPSGGAGGGGGTSGLGGITGSLVSDTASAQQNASDTINQGFGSNAFQSLANVIPQLGTQATSQNLQAALAGLASGSNATLQANTQNAPGSPDQPNSQSQATTPQQAAQYQAILAALLPNIKPGGANA